MAENNIQSNVNGKYLMFRGLPLVREGNVICYGNMDEKYVLNLMIMSYKTIETQDSKKKVEVPDKIFAQITCTDENVSAVERMVKQFEKDDLYEALDFGYVQLCRYNRK